MVDDEEAECLCVCSHGYACMPNLSFWLPLHCMVASCATCLSKETTLVGTIAPA